MQRPPRLSPDMHLARWDREKVGRFWRFVALNRDNFLPTFAGEQWSPGFLARVVSLLPRRGVVVEVGFGTGRVARRVVQRGLSYVGVESDEASVMHAREENPHPRATFEHGDATSLPLPDGAADAVLLFELLEHLDDDALDAALGEVRRVLRPGGRVVATTPNAEDLVANMVCCPDCGAAFHRVQHQRSFSAGSMEATLRAAGFESVRARPVMTQFGTRPVVLALAERLMPRRRRTLLVTAQAPKQA